MISILRATPTLAVLRCINRLGDARVDQTNCPNARGWAHSFNWFGCTAHTMAKLIAKTAMPLGGSDLIPAGSVKCRICFNLLFIATYNFYKIYTSNFILAILLNIFSFIGRHSRQNSFWNKLKALSLKTRTTFNLFPIWVIFVETMIAVINQLIVLYVNLGGSPWQRV